MRIPTRHATTDVFLTLLLIILVAAISVLSGCVAPTPGPVEPEPDPPPVVLTPVSAGELFGRDYSKRLAITCRSLSERAAGGEFTSLAELNDEWIRLSGADRVAAQSAIVASMNAVLIDETGELPGDVAAELFAELARGFEAGGKP
jgi:hypothetical protein